MITSQEREEQLEKLQDQIEEIFTQIKTAKSIEELKSIQNQDQYAYLKDKKFNIPESKYPRLDISLTKEDITSLKEKNFLDKDGVLCKYIATKNDLLLPLSPLEKLLYSILWKSGDLVKNKEKHIHDAVVGANDKEDGLVFYYFGKHLADKSNPIIDRHVIRAWKSFKAINDKSQNFAQILGSIDVTRKDKEACEKYIDWHNRCDLKKVDPVDFTYYVDRLLFALGKYLKDFHRRMYISNSKKD